MLATIKINTENEPHYHEGIENVPCFTLIDQVADWKIYSDLVEACSNG